ncbi:hypothetical protein WR25_09208 [Diploscapter pachys]|uniref:Carbonic anhydrase n=1 Tax=Diploscapter pachys TaxID=2018661 RepID=A0A2A2LYE6_9BILA|nr:hypothetical protein WR25_09208 [Diploscapter pachys]
MLRTIGNLLFATIIQMSLTAGDSGWGYDNTNGPHTWGSHCNLGSQQSPIDIRSADVDCTTMQSLSLLKYDTSGTVEIANNGRTLIVTGFDKWKDQPLMQGTGLDYTYRLEQIHFHWGYNRANGSEHTLNGRYYSAEIHLVHVREGMSLTEASELKDGLAVLGVWMTEGKNEKNFAQINDKSESVQFEGKFS